MKTSKYILSNILPHEELKLVLSSSAGIMGFKRADIAVTSERIFARYPDGNFLSFKASEIKHIDIRPQRILGYEAERGVIAVIGPYRREITIKCRGEMIAVRNAILEALGITL